MTATDKSPRAFAPSVRPNWRENTRLPRLSAADLLVEGPPVCRRATTAVPTLKGAVVLVGYTAAGLNDAKPTPVDPVMPGVEVLAEATEALVAGSAIRVPPAWLKYVIAALLVALTAFVFFRGEPHNDIDSIFVATNLLLLGAAFIGLTFFAYFFDVFAAVGFVSLVFGLCRIYAKIQRGRAVGNGDYLPDFDPAKDRWLAVARLHFVPDAGPRCAVGRAAPPRVPPPAAALPVRRHRRGDARGRRRGKDLAARRTERPRRADVAR